MMRLLADPGAWGHPGIQGLLVLLLTGATVPFVLAARAAGRRRPAPVLADPPRRRGC